MDQTDKFTLILILFCMSILLIGNLCIYFFKNTLDISTLRNVSHVEMVTNHYSSYGYITYSLYINSTKIDGSWGFTDYEFDTYSEASQNMNQILKMVA